MALQVHQFPCRTDNYGFLAHDPRQGVTACIDTPDEDPINAALEEKGWHPTHILTHIITAITQVQIHHLKNAGAALSWALPMTRSEFRGSTWGWLTVTNTNSAH